MTIATPFQTLWQQAGFKEETPIQQAVAKPLREDESIVGLAPTGSGKTLAFGLPLLEKALPQAGVQIVILAPSQELAVQTRDVLRPYAAAVGLSIVAVTGSANVKRQLEQLKKKPEVIVATAGRLLELVAAGKVRLHTLATLVVDEADELLRDPGLGQVRDLAMEAPSDVQLAFFSATPSPMFEDLAKWFGQDVRVIDVRAIDHTQGAVRHLFVQTDNAHRETWLRHLAHLDKFQALVFFNQNAVMEKVARTLSHQQIKFAVLSKTDRAANRAKALTDFRKGRLTLLLVTDMAGRGLDIPKLPAVINYQTPTRKEAYIHRAGRTGRMGEPGTVVTIGDDHDKRNLRHLVPQYDIRRAFLVDGKLSLTPPPRENAAGAAGVVADAAAATAAAPTRPSRPAAKAQPASGKREAVASVRKPHKKARARDQKNKGKRKPH
ncbi:DEAD/DEAH box helicase [Lacticaseibacillus parakribbianus]|uniref:DEAD/DEAH box helicase n=1 Tax=Lacticaseibacillus parakribbianus TaxID=2970927 RepID=UPI0021CB2F63|nr:DEAD/DEAH box helicase [Lacticaseibacillus parakribbianus]